MSLQHYVIKESNYFSNIRMDIISLIPVDPEQKILEIGAGTPYYISKKMEWRKK